MHLTDLTTALYGTEQGNSLASAIETELSHVKTTSQPWNEQSAIFITYADIVQQDGEKPLRTLKTWLDKHMQGITPIVHILPYHPYTSDGGFSVSDYSAVNEDFGDWNDINAVAESFQLMSDMVGNHTSQAHVWFQGMLAGNPEYDDFYVTADPNDEQLKDVTRARAHPLLTPFKTADGQDIHVWTTFSPDQVDVNYRNPAMMLAMVKVALNFIANGTRYIRLDAAHCMWKELGTSCMSLPQTHTICKIFRYVIEQAGGVLITETNLPHDENVSYFGNSDEAQMVYNFAMPALLLYTMHSGDASELTKWSESLALPQGCTFLNFTSSHDGFGVRCLEQILGLEKLHEFADMLSEQTGAKINYRLHGDGSKSPYEICATQFSLMNKGDGQDNQSKRFLAMETIKMLMRGIPAFYMNSLVAANSDVEGWNKTQHHRDLNRHKWELSELENQMNNPTTIELMRLIAQRGENSAFHPEGEQIIHNLGSDVFAITRISPDGTNGVNAVVNVTDKNIVVNWDGEEISLSAYQSKQFELTAKQMASVA